MNLTRPKTRFLFSPILFVPVIVGACLLSTCLDARADDIAGRATVTDADTIRIGNAKIRLFGIDAPESAQQCARDGKCYPCGQEATEALSRLLGASQVDCKDTGGRTYGRMVAVCFIDGKNVNAEIVRQGHAVPYWRYLSDRPASAASILAAYAEAKLKGSGIHAGEFVSPETWRHDKAARGVCR